MSSSFHRVRLLIDDTNIEMIDLTEPAYVPVTLQPTSPRYSILPAFPTSIYDEQSAPLLLANVPGRIIP